MTARCPRKLVSFKGVAKVYEINLHSLSIPAKLLPTPVLLDFIKRESRLIWLETLK